MLSKFSMKFSKISKIELNGSWKMLKANCNLMAKPPGCEQQKTEDLAKEVDKINKRTDGWKLTGMQNCNDRSETNGLRKTSKCGQCNGNGKTMQALVLNVNEREIALNDVAIPSTLKKDHVSIQVRYAGTHRASQNDPWHTCYVWLTDSGHATVHFVFRIKVIVIVKWVKIKAASFTDLCILEGKIPSCRKTIIPGRELSGVVCGAGCEVDNVQVGDNVVVAPCQPYTLCPYCLKQCCESCIKESCGNSFGVNCNGGWAQFATIPASMVYKICGISLDKAALLPRLAQIICTMESMKLSTNANILVQGCDLSGVFLTLLLLDRGYKNVYTLEDNLKKMQLLQSMETGYKNLTPDTLDTAKFDVIFTNGCGSHVIQSAMDRLNFHGHFYLFGQPGFNCEKSPVFKPCVISRRLLTIKGLSGTPVNPSNVSVELANKILDCCKLGVPIVPFTDYKRALTQLAWGDVSTVIFKTQKY